MFLYIGGLGMKLENLLSKFKILCRTLRFGAKERKDFCYGTLG